tara:strand:+ start:22415 stop:23704 length:1290 start_codon:yes stop_codon:yes gene_type:complete
MAKAMRSASNEPAVFRNQKASIAVVQKPKSICTESKSLGGNHSRKHCLTTHVNKPITHLSAGWDVPISRKVKSVYGVCETPLDLDFMKSAKPLKSLIEFGLNLSVFSEDNVFQALDAGCTGSFEQSSAFFSLADSVLNHLGQSLEMSSKIWLTQLENYNFKHSNEDWCSSFTFIGDDFEFVDCSDIKEGVLTSQKVGIDLLDFDLELYPQEIRQDIFQFIMFASRLSGHGTTIDMLLDDMVQWTAIGEAAELSLETKNEILSDVISGIDTDHAVSKHVDLEDIWCEADTLVEFLKGEKIALRRLGESVNLTENNVQNFLDNLKNKQNTSPIWLIDATAILLKFADLDLDHNEVTSYHGDLDYGFLAPIGFNLPYEQDILENTHQMSMQGEEPSILMLKLNKHLMTYLKNIDLGESLLLFLHQMLDQYHK